jgi:Na+-transporting NADH:ubiquinone oxidoreductase subunit NqrB
MRIAFASLLARTVLFTAATGQQFGFTNFPLNLSLPSHASLTLTWQGQDGYVNMTLSQFYYFGGGDVFKDIITSTSLTLTQL